MGGPTDWSKVAVNFSTMVVNSFRLPSEIKSHHVKKHWWSLDPTPIGVRSDRSLRCHTLGTQQKVINQQLHAKRSNITRTILRNLTIVPAFMEEKHLHISHMFRGDGYTLHLYIGPHCLTPKQFLNPNPIQIRKVTKIGSIKAEIQDTNPTTPSPLIKNEVFII